MCQPSGMPSMSAPSGYRGVPFCLSQEKSQAERRQKVVPHDLRSPRTHALDSAERVHRGRWFSRHLLEHVSGYQEPGIEAERGGALRAHGTHPFEARTNLFMREWFEVGAIARLCRDGLNRLQVVHAPADDVLHDPRIEVSRQTPRPIRDERAHVITPLDPSSEVDDEGIGHHAERSEVALFGLGLTEQVERTRDTPSAPSPG